jgi:uncharacterized protein (TIGR03085 family)
MASVAQRERGALCDLFLEVGPDAPTLCGEWTARDLAAHLVVRDRNLLGGAGIIVPFLSGFTEKGMEREEIRPWEELVDRVRSGPMWFTRPADELINTVEYFVHHEDVRRGDGTGEPRTGIDDVEDDLWGRLKGGSGRLFTRRVPKGIAIDLVRPDGATERVRNGDRPVRLVGTPGELVLYLFGRKAVARVELEGEDVDVADVAATDFGA